MPDFWFVLIAGLAACAGAIVQGGIGLGLGLVVTPIIQLIDPTLMPGAVLVMSGLMAISSMLREVSHVDWRGLSWAYGGRLAGTPLGVWVVASLPVRALGVIVGGVVLAALGVTSLTSRVPRNAATLVVAGLVAGATGTATSIGGPPIALLYQRESGPRVRSTLAVFFALGVFASLGMLAAAGHLPRRQVVAGLVVAPFVLAGFALSGPLRRHLDGGRMRAGVIVIVAGSAVVLVVRSLWSH